MSAELDKEKHFVSLVVSASSSQEKELAEALEWLAYQSYNDSQTVQTETYTRYWKEYPGLREKVVQLILHPNEDVMKNAVWLYQRFVYPSQLRVETVQFPGALDALMKVVQTKHGLPLFRALICVNNFSMDVNAALELRKRKDVLKWMKEHLNDESDEVKMYSTIITACVADESTLVKSNFPFENVDIILRMFDAVLEDRVFNWAKFTFIPPTYTIRCLCVSDKYREYLYSKNVVSRLIDCGEEIIRRVEKDNLDISSIQSMEHVFASLTQFSFDQKALQVMRSSPITERLSAVLNAVVGEDSKVKNVFPSQVLTSASACRFQIYRASLVTTTPSMKKEDSHGKTGVSLFGFGRRPSQTNRTVRSEQNDSSSSLKQTTVMISYQWSSKEDARIIEKALEKRGIQVWRDENQMKGDIIDAMAAAVHEADYVIVLVSSLYKQSANCKLECKLAHNSNKKIIPVLVEAGYVFKADGWLGAILGSLLYYDGTHRDKLDDVVAKLVHVEMKDFVPGAKRLSTGNARKRKTPNNPHEIQEWCKELGLTEAADALIREEFVSADDLQLLAESVTGGDSVRTLLNLKSSKECCQLFKALKSL